MLWDGDALRTPTAYAKTLALIVFGTNNTHMNKLIVIAVLTFLIGCATQKTGTTSNSGRGDTRTTEIKSLDDNTYLLTEQTSDKSYGYDKSNPIKVGGSKESSGPRNERRFLNALLGPNGEEVKYFRAGSCCAFKTPDGLIDNTGMLDHYRLTWTGTSDTLNIYLNMYDKGNLMIPVGLAAKKGH